MRRSKIIATLGPQTESAETISELIAAGVNVFRLNMSHAPHDWARAVYHRIRAAAADQNVPCGILMDTQGPAIRTGDLPLPLDLNAGDLLELTVKGAASEEEKSVDVNYADLVSDIHAGDTVLVDNGVIKLRVLEKLHRRIKCEVLTEGELGSRRHINLPGVQINMPAITDKDRRDIALGLELGVDWFALSFVRERKDVEDLRQMIRDHGSDQRIVAKIEDQIALQNLTELIGAADAIMVARGDLGIEAPYEELPIIQRRIVKACIRRGRPVIVATHMLESMIENPLPTRAEVTDVANAAYEEVDAIMLSGETAAGRYPVDCVKVMARIAERIERSGGVGYARAADLQDERQKMVRSAVVMANELRAKGILVFTRHGQMAQFTSWLRPDHSTIFAFTDSERVADQLSLYRGLYALSVQFQRDPEANIRHGEQLLRQRGWVASGDHIVVISDILAQDKLLNAVQMRLVE